MKMNCNWISSWPKSNYLARLLEISGCINTTMYFLGHSIHFLVQSHPMGHTSEYCRINALQIGKDCESWECSSCLRSFVFSCQSGMLPANADDLEIHFSASFISYSQHISSSIITIIPMSFENGLQKSFVATFGERFRTSSWGRWWCSWNDVGMLSHLFRSTFQSSSFTLFDLIVSPTINLSFAEVEGEVSTMIGIVRSVVTEATRHIKLSSVHFCRINLEINFIVSRWMNS